jgi:hypothetical protein
MSAAVAVPSLGDVKIEKGGAQWVLSAGDVSIDKGGCVAAVAPTVKVDHGGAVALGGAWMSARAAASCSTVGAPPSASRSASGRPRDGGRGLRREEGSRAYRSFPWRS